MPGKTRADLLLVEQGLAKSRETAQRLILAGQARLGMERVAKSSQMIDRAVQLSVDKPFSYVSRGALKLIKALDVFGVDVNGTTAMDIGASTGGFTEVLLERGASCVYSIDVGYGQLADKIRRDERVRVMERTNARFITPDMFDLKPKLTVIDVSFISIKLLLDTIFHIMGSDGRLIALIKPQFEAGRGHVGKGGIVRQPGDHVQVLMDVANAAEEKGFRTRRITYSPIKGQTGNIEFLFDIMSMTNNALYGKITNADIEAVVIDAHAVLNIKA